MKQISFLILSVFIFSACSSNPTSKEPEAVATKTPQSLPTTVEEAFQSSYRSEDNRQRDQYRHPVETLNFFGLKPEMTVVEISPGSGWYLEILAPLLASRGQYIGSLPAAEGSTYMTELNAKVTAWLHSHPEVESKIKLTTFNPSAQSPIAPDASADLVLTFRNVHNWMANGSESAAFQSFFKALKPGGVLGVVEHRENSKKKTDPKAKSGYVKESDIIRIAEKAGFKLEAKSEINANPKDTKDYPEGVWTLPPTYRLKDKERARYEAIGESDRMTLKFRKPLK
jgi:predicted methyltransferase